MKTKIKKFLIFSPEERSIFYQLCLTMLFLVFTTHVFLSYRVGQDYNFDYMIFSGIIYLTVSVIIALIDLRKLNQKRSQEIRDTLSEQGVRVKRK